MSFEPADREDIVVCAHEAMATTFRIHIAGLPADRARQAAGAAFAEIDRMESALSRYREGSDVQRVNLAEPGVWTRINACTADCLKTAIEIAVFTRGAFDPTLGALTNDPFPHPWAGERPRCADRDSFGSPIELDFPGLKVRKHDEGVRLDLGGIGKGFAVDCALDVLDDWDVPALLIDAGGSTTAARDSRSATGCWVARLDCGTRLRSFHLNNRAIAGSGMAIRGSHIIDGRLGQPVLRTGRVWACARSAAVADALSTAYFVMPWNEVVETCTRIPDSGAAVWSPSNEASPNFQTAGCIEDLLSRYS